MLQQPSITLREYVKELEPIARSYGLRLNRLKEYNKAVLINNLIEYKVQTLINKSLRSKK
ncbi:MAG: hypothetical protein PHT69_02245 [Bacteroidales bacterium]|nr:hypothetical protein [Bacteroidales bacterium]